jgi:hypothetical protein
VNKSKARQISGTFPVNLRRYSNVMATEDDFFGLRDPFLEKRRRDRALINVKQRDVVVGDLVKQDYEFYGAAR